MISTYSHVYSKVCGSLVMALASCDTIGFCCRSMYECVHASLTGTELVSTPFPAQPIQQTKQKEQPAANTKSVARQFRHWKW